MRCTHIASWGTTSLECQVNCIWLDGHADKIEFIQYRIASIYSADMASFICGIFGFTSCPSIGRQETRLQTRN
jgi:hypothetical protein